MQTDDLYALILTFSRWKKELFRLLRQPPLVAGKILQINPPFARGDVILREILTDRPVPWDVSRYDDEGVNVTK
jgi:hypothetical protein